MAADKKKIAKQAERLVQIAQLFGHRWYLFTV